LPHHSFNPGGTIPAFPRKENAMPITKYEGKELSKASFVMEECYFINCVLNDCDLFYSGGEAEFVNLTMNNCRWHFRGPALKTFQLLQNIGMLKSGQTPPAQMVGSTGTVH
jgi:hypothetical protein